MDGGGHDGNVSVFDKRRGGKGLANGLVDYHIETPDKIKSIFEGAGISTPSYNKLKLNNQQSIYTFKKAIAKAKQSLGNDGASVELKDDYTDINLYLSEDGESGFGIKPNGDIVSVFSSKKVKGRAHHLLEMAIYEGVGRQLDCFDIYLTKIYEAHGFKPVAKMKWDDEYIPEGWNKDNFKDYNNGEPDVVFMVYDPNNDIEKKHPDREIPYIVDYDDGEDIQHIHKWRSPAEREAIYNNMLERYKNAKTTEELKKVVFDNDKPIEVFNRQMDDLGSLSKEQAQSINAEYSKRYLELIKDENPEEYKKNKKYLEKKYNIKSDASIRLQRADAHINSLIDTIEYIDAKKKEFKEEDVNRDEDGKFAPKNSSKNKSKDNDTKDNDKKDGLDYGDLPKELHEPFKRLNTVKKAGEYIFNKNNEYKITEKDIKKKTDTYRKREKPDWVYVNLHNYYEIDDIGEHIGEPMNLTNRDNLKSDIEKFLFDFTCNSDEAKEKWGEKFESEIKPKLKQMIKNAPIPKGTLYRVETWTHGRDVEVGKSINFDCRSSSDDNMGYEVAVGFSQEDYEAGEEIYIFEFPEGTNALNIQGVSTYINEHEYLVDGDFIIESIEEDEFGYKQVKLVRPEDYEPPEPEDDDDDDEEEEEDGILDLRKYNEDEDDNYSPFDKFDPNWKPTPYGSDDDY
ncbi:hypothetical protein EPJ81_02300 [Brachyspira aalborgi]|uniref:Uncharacterized protein n=1 Tax=Brachyspira aalborgi TaxID=29522 RepID=A0A5C8ESY5_9SPIR|nr:hypothetical protein EPJ81_02300 [Brachyspira aalborgi]